VTFPLRFQSRASDRKWTKPKGFSPATPLKGEKPTPASLGHLHEAGVVGTSQGGVGVLGMSGDISGSDFHVFGSADIGVQGVSPHGAGVSALAEAAQGASINHCRL
jgi:hypothetical protein